MELIIKISDKMFDAFKKHGIMTFDNLDEYDKDMIADAIANGTLYNPSGDAISREALKDEVRKHAEYYADRTKEDRYNVGYTECACEVLDFIDNASTVPLPNEQIAWEQGYEAGLAQGKHDRPKGDCENCDFRKFTDKFVDGVVEVMNKKGITSIEQLSEILKGGAE